MYIFNKQQELRQLLPSNFYSTLYHNSEIWHMPTLNIFLKQQLLSPSAMALEICIDGDLQMISFIKLHKINKRATPEKYLYYELQLYKVLNGMEPVNYWLTLHSKFTR